MDDLKSILDRVLKSSPGLKESFDENQAKIRVFEAWERVVGERVARHCWPIRLLDDTKPKVKILLIGAESSAWLHSLRFLEAQILEKYEKELKSKVVAGLRYKLESRRPTS